MLDIPSLGRIAKTNIVDRLDLVLDHMARLTGVTEVQQYLHSRAACLPCLPARNSHPE
jgi:hypothetical protein